MNEIEYMLDKLRNRLEKDNIIHFKYILFYINFRKILSNV